MEEINSEKLQSYKGLSFFSYLKADLHRGYLLENDEERYAARREKVYTFFKIPRELEKFLAYGFFHCLDSFLFVIAFLPIRFMLALACLFVRPIRHMLRLRSNRNYILKPAEIVDLLKGILLIVSCYFILYIDTSACYHIIKTQSTIKLYIFFNMLEIAEKLMSAFGQDTLDALFWTATEPRDRKREHFGLIFHLIVACAYVILHSVTMLLQALCFSVAINSDNKGLLTIVISNNFIELKGAVFKKFDRNNLLQISCSDVRERFHLGVLLFIVVVQTMKEYAWKEERLWILLPDCFLVLGIEIMIDWLKHAFITRFNNIGVDAYSDYTLLISSDLIMCKQKYAYSDHSDLVARRMGFIPLPLGVVIFRVLIQSMKITNALGVVIFILGFQCLFTLRVLNGIVILGKACNLMNKADQYISRSRQLSENVDKANEKISSNNNTPSNTFKSSVGQHLSSEMVSTIHIRTRTPSRSESPFKHIRTNSLDNAFQHREMIQSAGDTTLTTNEKEVHLDDIKLVYEDDLSSSSKTSTSGELLESSPSDLDLSTTNGSCSTIVEAFNTEVQDSTLPGDALSSLPFLSDSQTALMANSMVSLNHVGIGSSLSNIMDFVQESSIPPNASSGGNSLSGNVNKSSFLFTQSLDDSATELNTINKNYAGLYSNDSTFLQPSPFLSSTQSCPCFVKLLKNDPSLQIHSQDTVDGAGNSEDASSNKLLYCKFKHQCEKCIFPATSEDGVNFKQNFEYENKPGSCSDIVNDECTTDQALDISKT